MGAGMNGKCGVQRKGLEGGTPAEVGLIGSARRQSPPMSHPPFPPSSICPRGLGNLRGRPWWALPALPGAGRGWGRDAGRRGRGWASSPRPPAQPPPHPEARTGLCSQLKRFHKMAGQTKALVLPLAGAADTGLEGPMRLSRLTREEFSPRNVSGVFVFPRAAASPSAVVIPTAPVSGVASSSEFIPQASAPPLLPSRLREASKDRAYQRLRWWERGRAGAQRGRAGRRAA